MSFTSNAGTQDDSIIINDTASVVSGKYDGTTSTTVDVQQTSNYPLSDPIFYVPPLPTLTKIPLPSKCDKKPPVAGYDIKTLRRQIEFLQQEIVEKTTSQTLISRQNEELWLYTKELLHANKSNAVIVKDQMRKLHNELKILYDDRYILAEKLQNARNSSVILNQLKDEFESLKVKDVDMQRLESEAQYQLNKARNENIERQHELQEKINQMRDVYQYLDDYRNREREEQLNIMADDFWTTNKSILNTAYKRFKVSVHRSIRLSNIGNTLTCMYHRHNKKSMWTLWLQYMRRRSFMKKCIVKKCSELTSHCYARWKIFAALEKHFKASNRLKLTRHVFSRWKNITQESIWIISAEDKIKRFQLKSYKRMIFIAWKRTCMFLSWNSKSVLRLEVQASTYFQKKLFYAWKMVTITISNVREMQVVSRVRLLQTRRLFRCWLIACRMAWKRRGTMFKTFFTNMRKFVQQRAVAANRQETVQSMYAYVQKMVIIRRWRRLVYKRKRSLVNIRRRGRTDYAIYGNTLRHTLLELSRYAAVSHRLRVCYTAACRRYRRVSLAYGLETFYKHMTHDRTRRLKKERQLTRRCFSGWTAYVVITKREGNIIKNTGILQSMLSNRLKMRCLGYWHTYKKKVDRLTRCRQYLQDKCMFVCLRKSWRCWRNSWCKALYWREKEVLLDNSRRMALLSLRDDEILQLNQEIQRVQFDSRDLEESIVNLKSLISKREFQLTESHLLIEEHTCSISVLEADVAKLRDELSVVREERERLKGIETSLAIAKKHEEDALVKRKEDTAKMMRKMEKENQALRMEAMQAQEQSIIIERLAEQEIEKDESILNSSIDISNQFKLILANRQEVESTLIRQNQEMSTELRKVNDRIIEVQHTGTEVLDESMRRIREYSSEVNVLRNNAGIAQARVDELRKLVGEKRAQVHAIKSHRIHQEEAKELDELSRMNISTCLYSIPSDSISTIDDTQSNDITKNTNSIVRGSRDTYLGTNDGTTLFDNDDDSSSVSSTNDNDDDDVYVAGARSIINRLTEKFKKELHFD